MYVYLSQLQKGIYLTFQFANKSHVILFIHINHSFMQLFVLKDAVFKKSWR